jgi:hypothetical protein
MDDPRTIGRIVGALLLAQLIAGPIENFTLMGPVVAAPGFLLNAAAHPRNLALAATLGFGLCLASIAIAVVAWPLFRRRSPRLALAFLAITLLGAAVTLVEGMAVMSMLSLSQAYAAAYGADEALYQGLGIVVGAARNWAHYADLVVGGLATAVMFGLLFRERLVPGSLAGFGIAAALVQMYAIGRPFFGVPVQFQLLMPLGLAYLATSAWLLWRGFVEPDR